MLYTYNPNFKTISYWKKLFAKSKGKRNITPRRKKLHDEYMKYLKEFELDEKNIHFLDDNSGKTFVRESEFIIFHWLENYKHLIENHSIIFHDYGTALAGLSNASIIKLKSLKIIEYPPDIHHLLSPNDNKWHGVAKAKWRNLCRTRAIDKTGGVESSLLLLKCLVDVKSETIKKNFQRNLFIKKKIVKINDLEKLIIEDKKLIYNSKEVLKSMKYFSRWRHGKLRDVNITYQYGINFSSTKYRQFAKLFS